MESRSKGENQVDPRKVVGLLADEKRLRAFAAITLGAKTLEEVTTMTGLDAASATRCLGQLASGGLVETDAATGLRLRTDTFRAAARLDRNHGAEPGGPGSVMRDGRLPKSREARLAALRQLADLFDRGRRYPENEVNSRLRVVDPDYAFLRRSLVDDGFMERANEEVPGGRTNIVYWRTHHADSPEIAP